MLIKLSPKTILIFNLAVIGLLLALDILAVISRVYLGNEISMFDFDIEGNIPSFYSFSNLLISSLLLFLIAFNCKEKARSLYISWLGLFCIFLFLAFDELLSVHEKLGTLLKHVFETSGLFLYIWVIPYGIAVILFAILYYRFFFKLPLNIRPLFLLSGMMFVSGAIGLEMISGRHADQFGKDDLIYGLYYTSEELLEMVAIAIFIYALLTHITVNQGESVTLAVTHKPD